VDEEKLEQKTIHIHLKKTAILQRFLYVINCYFCSDIFIILLMQRTLKFIVPKMIGIMFLE